MNRAVAQSRGIYAHKRLIAVTLLPMLQHITYNAQTILSKCFHHNLCLHLEGVVETVYWRDLALNAQQLIDSRLRCSH